MEKKRFRKSRIVYVILGVLYMLILIAATVYSLGFSENRLPIVDLAPPGAVDGLQVPVDYVREQSDGMWSIDTVQQIKGPWGYRYIIKQIKAENVYPVEGDEGRVWFYTLRDVSDPIVARCSEETYEGMEVRLGG